MKKYAQYDPETLIVSSLSVCNQMIVEDIEHTLEVGMDFSPEFLDNWMYSPELDQLIKRERNATNTEINVERDRRLHMGFECWGKIYDSDLKSRTALAAAVAPVHWITKNNDVIYLDANMLETLRKTLSDTTTKIVLAAKYLKEIKPTPQDWRQDDHWP